MGEKVKGLTFLFGWFVVRELSEEMKLSRNRFPFKQNGKYTIFDYRIGSSFMENQLQNEILREAFNVEYNEENTHWVGCFHNG